MLECVNLSVLKIEGLGDLSQCSCFVYGDGTLLDTVTMKGSKTQPVFIDKSLLKLVLVDDPSSQPISSLSFDMKIIQRPGFHWLPLFLTTEDRIASVPEEVALPRILIDLHPYILAPVLELTESSDNAEDSEIDPIKEELEKTKVKNAELVVKAIELENELAKRQKEAEKKIEEITNEYKTKLSKLSFELEKGKSMYSKHTKMLHEALKENENLHRNNEGLAKENRELHEKMNRFVKFYQDVKHKENSISVEGEESEKGRKKDGCGKEKRQMMRIVTQKICDLRQSAGKKHEKVAD